MFSVVSTFCGASRCCSYQDNVVVPVLDAAIGVALFLIAYQVIKINPSMLASHQFHMLSVAGFSCCPLILLITASFGRCLNHCFCTDLNGDPLRDDEPLRPSRRLQTVHV